MLTGSSAALPVVLGGLALSDCGVAQGCLRGVPGSHRWGILKHEESDDPRSILSKGQYITDAFDEAKAVDFALRPGEMVLFDNSLVHGSGANLGPDPRFLLLVEMLPTWAKPPRVRQRPCSCVAWTPTATSTTSRGPTPSGPRPRSRAGRALVNARARLIFADSKGGPSEAYGGTRPAT